MNRIGTKLCTDHIGTKFCQLQFQTTDSNRRCQILRFTEIRHSIDYSLTICNCRLNLRYTYKIPIIIYTDGFSVFVCFRRCICKLRCTIFCKFKRYNRLGFSCRAAVLICCFRIGNIISDKNNGTISLQLFNCFIIQNITVGSVFFGSKGIIFFPAAVLLFNEIEIARLSKFFQYCICILGARNFNINPVTAFLVYLCLRAVLFYTLLKLINGIIHIFLAWFPITVYFISNADTTCKIKPQLDIMYRSGILYSKIRYVTQSSKC